MWEVYWVLWSWGGPAKLFQMEAIVPCVDGLPVQLSPGRGYASGSGAPFPRETQLCAPSSLGNPCLGPGGSLGDAP